MHSHIIYIHTATYHTYACHTCIPNAYTIYHTVHTNTHAHIHKEEKHSTHIHCTHLHKSHTCTQRHTYIYSHTQKHTHTHRKHHRVPLRTQAVTGFVHWQSSCPRVEAGGRWGWGREVNINS